MSHPYENLPEDRYWRTAVGNRGPFQIEGLWKPKFRIRKRTTIVTAGSCFAQHFSRALVARGYRWHDAEPAPEMMTEAARKDFHYGTFSFRTGNIYTTRMLRQWISWAVGETQPPEILWEKDGRFYDPFRPGVEPGGFDTDAEAYASRAVTVAAVRSAIEAADVFVFTLGLTEAWEDIETGAEFAVCPGTIAGQFDESKHRFVNHGYSFTSKESRRATKLARQVNPNLKFLLTVSPVPLTATASEQHVLTATSYSKSVLRAVAGTAAEAGRANDYFPSYEIITHPAFRGMFYQTNQRSVDPHGVDFVMSHFFRDQEAAFSKTVSKTGPYGVNVEQKMVEREDESDLPAAENLTEDELRCEEEIYDAFS